MEEQVDEGNLEEWAALMLLLPVFQIFNCVMNLRCNEKGQLGFWEESAAQFSPFYVCSPPEAEAIDVGQEATPTTLELPLLLQATLACLKHVSITAMAPGVCSK